MFRKMIVEGQADAAAPAIFAALLHSAPEAASFATEDA